MNTKNESNATDWWYYFEKTNEGKNAKCKFCDWEKPRGITKSTTKLKQHLESKLGICGARIQTEVIFIFIKIIKNIVNFRGRRNIFLSNIF